MNPIKSFYKLCSIFILSFSAAFALNTKDIVVGHILISGSMVIIKS
jgi:hypothetical protein